MSVELDHTLTLSSIARRNDTTVRKVAVAFGTFGFYPAGRIKNANVYKAEDVARVEELLRNPVKAERDVNAQSMGKQEFLDHLLATGQQERYEAELEYIRTRRRENQRARDDRFDQRAYNEAVDDREPQPDAELD